ncbi:hypothetical protein MMC31_005729 [Peltigera leucophlebia]|nr:hypothetical protein [Peltigera leucophlebia]
MPPIRKLRELRPAPFCEVEAIPQPLAPFPRLGTPFPSLPTPLPVSLPPLPASTLTPTTASFPTSVIADTAIALKVDFAARFAAALGFPPPLNVESNRASISRYQAYMNEVVDSVKAVCCCCNLFVSTTTSAMYNRNHSLIRTSITSGLLIEAELDCCGISDQGLRFCKQCVRFLRRNERPKFGLTNGLPRVSCQSYPPELDCLSIAEEAAIARAHPVVSILKLRPNGAFNPSAYHRIKGHAILLPQNPAPLLNILPSPTLALHDVIRIVWSGAGHPTDYDLRHFIQIRKQKIIEALTWLQQNNPHYHDVVINHTMLETMPNEFIPEGISSRIVTMDQDHTEREGYAANLSPHNDENDLHHAVHDAGLDHTGLLSGCIYMDVNESRQNPYLKLISAINNVHTGASCNDRSPKNDSEQPVITFNLYGNRIPLNNWDNANFFPVAFPTLFLYGDGGYNTPRGSKISLQAWPNWALSHHFRQFARHPLFMYMVYDVIQRRSAALGYSLLVKSKQWSATQGLIAKISHKQLCDAAEAVRTTNTCRDPAILALERQVQLVAAHTPHSFAKYYQFRLHL